ncbi:MAG: diaminopimelate epimerase [Gammaproteobacteria bacterium]|nr:MAG: diaminopimelate epimerase [Gammaproteobacteria bacterium]
MNIAFTKMHGLGNDVIVIEALDHGFNATPEQIRQLADRHFGIGFDQLLLVEPPTSEEMDFSYRIFNADGSEVEQCGNGARCFARFVYDRGLTEKTEIRVGTLSGIIVPRLLDDGLVCVDMGAPEFEPEKIPFIAEGRQRLYPLSLDGVEISIAAVSMGNPHAVQIVNDIDDTRVSETGAQIEQHPRFPLRANAGFMQIVNRQAIRLRVWERGSGETLACGTGACAAVVAGIDQGFLDSPVKVFLRGGSLSIEWAGDDAPVLMTGPAEYVYEGMFEMEKL